MIKRVLKYIGYGIIWGWCWFVATCLIADLVGADAMLSSIFANLRWQILASTISGIGFGASAIVYTVERLHLWQQVLIHFMIGMGTYIPTAFISGWIPSGSVGMVAASILISIVIFFLIWSGFYLYHRYEAKRINEKLKAQDFDK